MHNIPVVFAFDENYRLPAWVAISSLLESRGDDCYDIFVLHNGLSSQTMAAFEALTPIRFIKVDENKMKAFPTSTAWPLSVYYRLLIPEIFEEYDKIIYSDVDVFFKKSLKDIYALDISNFYWGGVKAERNHFDMVVHTYFPENKNKYVFMSGFMLINAAKMRSDHMKERFFETIRRFDKRLKMFDLEVLNLSCSPIAEIPFEYCVLENIYEASDIRLAPEYLWLSRCYTDQNLLSAKENPAIIHYAGRDIKIWGRPYPQMPSYYQRYVLASPFCVKARTLKKKALWLLSKLPLPKQTRRSLRYRSQNL